MKEFCRLVEDYLAWQRTCGAAERIVHNTRWRLRVFTRWLAKSEDVRSPEQLTRAVFGRWDTYTSTLRRTDNGLPLRPISVFTVRSTVRTFCWWLVRHGHLPKGALVALSELRMPRVTIKTAMNHQQVRKFLDAMPTGTPGELMLCAIAELLYSTGARIGEALAMDVADIDFDLHQARLFGKGRKERLVPIGKRACRKLENYIKGVRPLLLGDPGEEALWLNSVGGRLRYTAFRASWSAVASRVPSEMPVTAYSFRRACATELIRSGADLWSVKELLGHENLSCLEYYVRLDLNDLKRAHAKYHPRDNGMGDTTQLTGSS
jgi:integrase/recombinase XerD